MSVFVFDKDTLDMLRYLLAMKHFKEYSIGPQGIDLHLCALTLERVLIQTGLNYPKFQKEKPSDLKIFDIAKFLSQKNIVNPSVASELIDYVNFHDAIMRTGAQITNEAAQTRASQLLRFLCTEAGINIEKESNRAAFEEIVNLRVGLPLKDQTFGIDETDFDCLDRLFLKSGFIQKEIAKKLVVRLKPAKASGFTPYTGGILLPFVTEQVSDMRGHIDNVYLGVIFTPGSIRIGLDFGAQAHKFRVKYYEMLLNGNLTGEIETLRRKAADYCFCDTYWYYHTRNLQSLQWGLTVYGSTRLAIENAIEETKQMEGTALSGHRYLISRVIQRRPEDFTYIAKGIINDAARNLNELYPILELIDKPQVT
ncbi:MAG: hypothetical protein NWE93_04170 [Candidatus Bathyarchaeota archaeon]|nr:hypothetical protein [Candidatus Bathyarchaeota archaeon]